MPHVKLQLPAANHDTQATDLRVICAVVTQVVLTITEFIQYIEEIVQTWLPARDIVKAATATATEVRVSTERTTQRRYGLCQTPCISLDSGSLTSPA